MKRASLCALLLIVGVSAALPAAAADMRVAAIRGAKLVSSAPEYKKAEEALRAEFEGRAKSLADQEKQLSEDLQKFQRDADIMSTSEKEKKQLALQTRIRDFEVAKRNFAEGRQLRERELMNELLASISEVIAEVAKEGKYDLVVQDPVFAVDSIDITETVLKRLKKRNK